MTAGVEIINDYGTSLINNKMSAFGYITKGTVTLTDDGFGHPDPLVVGSVSISGISPLMAINAPVGTSGYAVNHSGSTWTFYLRAQSASPVTVSYWIFDNAHALIGTLPTYGKEVFRDDGVTLAWHSSIKLLYPVDRVVLTPASGINGDDGPAGAITSNNYPSGKTYAVIQPCFSFHTETYNTPTEDEPPAGRKYMTTRTTQSASYFYDADTIVMGAIPYEIFINDYPMSTAESSFSYGDLKFWVIDVTDY